MAVVETARAALAKTPTEGNRRPAELSLPWYKQLAFLKNDFLGLLRYAAKESDGIVCLRPLPWMPIYLVTDATLAKEILAGQGEVFEKSKQTHLMVSKFLGQGLVLSEGDSHRRDKKIVGRLFFKHASRARVDSISRELLNLRLQNYSRESVESVDVETFFNSLSFDIILALIFGRDVMKSGKAVSDALREFAAAIAKRFETLPLPEWVPTRQNRRERLALATVERVLRDCFANLEPGSFAAELRAALTAEHAAAASAPEAFSLWRDHIVTLLFAGHETVAKLVAWAILKLGGDADLQDELRGAGLASDEALLDSFVKETLRFRPPVWVFDRTPVKDLNIGAFSLRAGCKIYISPYVLHFDERHFVDPETFMPKRFIDAASIPGPGPGLGDAFLPFGWGRRACLGQDMAVTEAKALIDELLARYYVFIDPQTASALKPKPGATLGFSAPFQMQLRPRS